MGRWVSDLVSEQKSETMRERKREPGIERKDRK